jgi:hypothetical protein
MDRLLIGAYDKLPTLLRLMQEDFDRGLLLIDPTGTIAPEVADRIPAELTQRMFYFNPTDREHVPGFNVLANVEPDDRHRVAEDLCAFFRAFNDGVGEHTLTKERSDYLLLNVLRVLLDVPDSTLLSIPTFLRAMLVGEAAGSSDPIVRGFWKDFADLDYKTKQQTIADLQAQVGKVLTSPVIRNIVGQRHSTFSLDKGYIIIANLDRSKLGDKTAKFLGSLLISRSTGPVYINDFSFFSGDHFTSYFAQDRFTVTLNNLSQVSSTLQNALLQFPDIHASRTTIEDAQKLKYPLGVLEPRILTEEGPDEAEPIPEPLGRLEAVIRRSRACHTRPRAQVERDISRNLS